MNEKIENLLKELQMECKEQDVTLICTVAKENKAKNLAVGSLISIANCLAVQEKALDKDLPIPVRILKMAASFDEGTPKHTFVTDDINDIPSIVNQILRGEFE